MNRLILPLFFLLSGCVPKSVKLSGHFLGQLQFPTITYHIYIDAQGETPIVINTTFKAEPLQLDTIWFRDDSLYFQLDEFYSAYRGYYDRDSKRIVGQWIDEDSVVYPLDFLETDPDTISGLHPRTHPYVYTQPVPGEDKIRTATVGEQNFAQPSVDSLINNVINGRYSNIHSLLIARNNCLIVEEYFYRFGAESIYNIQSATKSFVSALTGIAIDKGNIKSVHDPLCLYLDEYKQLACNEQNKNISIQQLLTMNTGIPWNEQQFDYGDERNSLSIAANERDQLTYLLGLTHVKSESPNFSYNSLNHILMNVILRNATHLENKQELTERLFKPLGIEKSYIDDPTPMGAIGDIGLRSRDMLKFGLLYLNNGMWNNQQIVSAEWIEESTTAKIKPNTTLGYSYFWWTRDFNRHGKPISSYFAWGYGGQYIIVIPEMKIVVVLSGSNWSTNPEGQMVDIVEEILAGVM